MHSAADLFLGTVKLGVPEYGFSSSAADAAFDALGFLRGAKELGVNRLDTSPRYGNSEEVIGQYIKETSSMPFVASKIDNLAARDPPTPPPIEHHLKNSFEEIHKEFYRSLKEDTWRRVITRDQPIEEYFKIKVISPFLDKEIIKIAMKLHPMFKINKETKKIILREFAKEIGLGEFSFRAKRAGQYGSGFDKAIERLTRESNLKFKKDYINFIS